MYDTKGRQDLALKEYEEALRIFPELAPAARAIGWIHFHKGRVDVAMDYFSQALKINPEDPDATFGIGRVYDEKRKPELGAQHYTRALELERDPSKKATLMNFIDKAGGYQH